MPATRRDLSADPEACIEAARVVSDGGVVAFPTETVYGLGARPDCAEALDRIRTMKGREASQPFQVLIDDTGRAAELGARVDDPARRVMDRFWPGPLTLVLPAVGGGTVGLRMPAAEELLHLLRAVGGALAATSANRHGEPPAMTPEEIDRLFGDRIDLLLAGNTPPAGQASTVAALQGGRLRLLRPGPISSEALEEALADGADRK